MGFFKKPAAQVDNDDEIRREIRARVAKQAGIYDEEYIKTGKIGGNKTGEAAPEEVTASHVSAAAVPIMTDNGKGEAELSFEPQKKEPSPQQELPQQPKPVAQSKNVKEKKPSKQNRPPKERKTPRNKKRNLPLILFIVILLLAFIPLYYFLTGSGNNPPDMSATSSDNMLLLAEPLLVQGTVSDADNENGVKIYYSLDNGSASLLYTFDAGPGPFEYEIELPVTTDFVGEHAISLYAEDQKGEVSESVSLNFTVTKPALTGLAIATPPSDVSYKVGETLKLQGLVVSATYEDGSVVPVTTFTSSIPDGTKLSSAGTIAVTVSYAEGTISKTAVFNITVTKVTKPPVTPTRQVNSSYPIPSLELYYAGPGAADLQWNSLSGVNGYQIQRKTGSGGSWTTVKTISSAYTSWTDGGPVAGKTYYYRICSYKVVGGVKVFSNFSSSKSIAL